MFKRAEKLLCLFVCLAILGLAGCGTNGFTSTQQGNFSNIPQGKGNNPEPGNSSKPEPVPEGHWESLLVANGIIYAGSDNGQLYAFDAQSGKILWQRKQHANSLYAIAGKIIYAVDQTSGNVLHALDASNGNALWQHAVASPIDSVQVDGGTVYLDVGNTVNASIIYALNATSGAQLWQYAENGEAEAGLVSVGNGRVYIAPLHQTSDGLPDPQVVNVLNANTGQQLWQLILSTQDGMERNGIVEVNGTTYVATSNGALYAVQTNTGHVLWHVRAPANALAGIPAARGNTPVIVDGAVYVGDMSSVAAYRASDGKQLWQYQPHIGMGGPAIDMQPMVANGVVYFATQAPDGSLVALRASNGTVLWQTRVDDGNAQDLELVDGRIIEPVGHVTVWQASNGQRLWTRSTDNGSSGPTGPVRTSAGVVYVGEGNGNIQALRISDGTQLWHYQIQELPVSQPPVYGAVVTFTNSTSYNQAIQIVSDLGLKTFADCRSEWVPEDDEQNYANYHAFTVAAMTNSAPLWLERLQATPGVAHAQAQGIHGCFADIPGPHPIQRLQPKQAGAYLQVSFASNISYTQAWQSLNALGFRLADPCYEAARAQSHKPTWQSMGEESSFAQTHTLTVATTNFNATIWQQQLQKVTGISHVATPKGAVCN